MLSYSFSHIAFLFTAYSIIGWICESFIASILSKKFVNRGFLFGPYCPAYGIGMLLVLIAGEYVSNYPVIIFLISAVLATLVEVIVGFLFEYTLSVRWWDHSKEKFNFNGRTGLINFFLFGILGVLAFYFMEPFLESTILWFYPESLRVLMSMLLATMILDMIFSVASMADIRMRMEQLKDIIAKLKEINKKYDCFTDENSFLDDLEKYLIEHSDNKEIYGALSDLEAVLDLKRGSKRILEAFPRMVPLTYTDEYNFLLAERYKLKKGARVFARKCDSPNSEETKQRDKSHCDIKKSIRTAYTDMDVTKLIWIFMIGCVAGYVIETLYCVLHNGYIESRQGMIYGPFSQVYGFGAVILALLLDPISKKKMIWVFLASVVIGGLFEAGIGYMQEIMFGTRSWDYSNEPLSMFGGRTSAFYMVMWGVLGTVYMRIIYPGMSTLVKTVPAKARRFLTISIAVILSLDLLVSGIAVDRWEKRQHDIPSSNSFEKFIDEHYDDKFMKEIYPHMKVS